MGLRAASVRHSNAVVMAPALTEAGQSQNFSLPPSSPINSVSQNGEYITGDDSRRLFKGNGGILKGKYSTLESNYADGLLDSFGKLSDQYQFHSKETVTKLRRGAPKGEKQLCQLNTIMNNSPTHMDDQDTDTMGLQKAGMEAVASLLKDKNISNDVQQLLNNFESEMPENDITATGDIGHNVDDLMQVINMEHITGTPRLGDTSTVGVSSETEVMFPMPFDRDLFSEVDMMTMCEDEQLGIASSTTKESRAKETIEELYKKQIKLERRSEFLLRRLRKLQVRAMGQHVSSEIVGLFEHIHRTLKRVKENGDGSESTVPQNDTLLSPLQNLECEPIKPITSNTMKSLVKKLEMSVIHSNIVGKQRPASRYFGSGSVDYPSMLPNRGVVSGVVTVPKLTVESRRELDRVAGLLHSELGMVEHQVDSDATASSSGGESCDEMQSYNNPHQQLLSTSKRAAWKYANERAAVASRWTWLQAQISDLEYRIRQHNELHRQIRACKGIVTLGDSQILTSVPGSPQQLSGSSESVSPGAVNGYRGQLPGATKSSDDTGVHNGTINNSGSSSSSARTRPLNRNAFKKRKLIQTTGLHALSKKAGRPSNIRCGCVEPVVPCALCTGRTDPTFPRDMPEQLTIPERIALLDPGYHPVLSFSDDVPQSIHIEAIMKLPDWQQRSMRSNLKQMKSSLKIDRTDKNVSGLEIRPKKSEHRRKYNRLLKTNNINPLNTKIKHKLSRGRKPFSRNSSINRVKKRHTAKVAMAQLQALATESVDEEMETLGGVSSTAGDSLTPSPLSHVQVVPYRRSRVNSYDIDNIVIPYSVAASTRVEKLQYKEILTPKWRVVDVDFPAKYDIKNNGIVRRSSQDSDVEDLNEETVAARHEKCEHDERKKFLSYIKFPLTAGRSRANRRTDSRAESSGANTPDPMSPHAGERIGDESVTSPLTSPPATPLSVPIEDQSLTQSQINQSVLRRRTVSQSQTRWIKDRERDESAINITGEAIVDVAPYEPRLFPLSDDVYEKMLKNMPDGHPLPYYLQKQTSKDSETPGSPFLDSVCSPISDSTESVLAEEDPNDPEWVDVERVRDRTKR